MKIVVLGLWHQGCVTAACASRHFAVTGLDFDATTIANLQQGRAPLFEPGLNERIAAQLASGTLRFTMEVEAACGDADVLWVTFDTPVDDDDEPDVEGVLAQVLRCVPALPPGALVLLSSQLPVGSCRRLEDRFGRQGYRFACSPENLRLGKAIVTFENAERIIVGCRDARSREQLTSLLGCFTPQIIWMSCESAEMTKHAINSFLALSITYMNEVARICEVTGADAKEVEQGLKSESRIGPGAYLSPGGAFAGGTLARDVVSLTHLAAQHSEQLELIPAIKRSNDAHRHWAFAKLQLHFRGQSGRQVALLGLTYKAGTNTLRRSSAVELARALHAVGVSVRAYDPSHPELPPDLAFIALHTDPYAAANGADAVVVGTDWPQFQELDWPRLTAGMRQAVVIDATRYVAHRVTGIPGVTYTAVGLPI